MLIMGAHATDYVWHSGGTIAKYIRSGADVRVVVLNFGVRGESNDLWEQKGATVDSVRETGRKETMEVVTILGIQDIESRDLPDYPMAPALASEVQERLIRKIREVRSDTILTHDRNGEDVLSPDRNAVSQLVLECSIQSNSNDVRIEGMQTTKQMRLYGFKPRRTEPSKSAPGSFIDIAEVYEQKVAAMECSKTRDHLIEYYMERALLRGNHIRRISGSQTYKYAECFPNFFPTAGKELY